MVTQAAVGAVRDFSDDLPRIVEDARRSDLGSFVNSGGDSLDTSAQHTARSRAEWPRFGGVADVGVSAFGAVPLALVMFLTLFGVIDEPRLRGWVGGCSTGAIRALPAGRRSDRPDHLALHVGNLAISVVCGTCTASPR